MALLWPALVARGVVAVGAHVLVVVVRGDGGTAGCWAEVEDGAVAELFQRVQIPALAAGGSCGRLQCVVVLSLRRCVVRRLRRRLGALGATMDLIVISPGSLGCSLHFAWVRL